MGRAARPKPIREILEVLLVNRFQQHGHRPLQHFVLDGGPTEGSSLLAVAFGDMYPLDWRRDVAPAFDPVEQAQQVLFPVLALVGPSLAIHAGSAVRFDPLLGCL
jgi:hypothetical protein